MNLAPNDPSYPAGYRRAKARLTYARLIAAPAEDPARRAAFGRMLYHGGDGHRRAVPQLNATSIEAIAWFRESGTRPGFMNRRHRRLLRTAR